MRVLITGSEGLIGRSQVAILLEAGHELRTFDKVARHPSKDIEHIPGDLNDIMQVRKAVQGMDAVVHLAAIPSDRAGRGPEVMQVNVMGTSNILFACLEAEVSRVIAFSSINALGAVGGHRTPEYLPVDDDYPRHPMTPYQLSKHLGEETCRSFSEKYGMVTICFRPVFVMNKDNIRWLRDRAHPGSDREKWEYFAYVYVEDVCDAAMKALTVEGIAHDAFLLTADDTTSSSTTDELTDRYYADIPWKQDRTEYLAGAQFRSLIDCTHAKNALGWQPKFSFRNVVED